MFPTYTAYTYQENVEHDENKMHQREIASVIYLRSKRTIFAHSNGQKRAAIKIGKMGRRSDRLQDETHFYIMYNTNDFGTNDECTYASFKCSAGRNEWLRFEHCPHTFKSFYSDSKENEIKCNIDAPPHSVWLEQRLKSIRAMDIRIT